MKAIRDSWVQLRFLQRESGSELPKAMASKAPRERGREGLHELIGLIELIGTAGDGFMVFSLL